MQLQLLLVLSFGVSIFCATESKTIGKNVQLGIKRNQIGKKIKNSFEDDEHLSTTQLASKYGYPTEIHHVTTDDGYILELHRIPREKGVPVLLVHGLLDASSSWVMMGPDKGFAYMLSDLKYDVWMANVRGNTYSRKHKTLSPDTEQFWNFTFHEIGIYDIPAIVDYVLRTTNFTSLHYIGHSQGATSFFVMCSMRPEYNSKIISMQALAPAVFIGKCKSPLINFLASIQNIVFNMLQSLGRYEFMPANDFLINFIRKICKTSYSSRAICSDLIFWIVGFDEAQMNNTMQPVILGHTPAGASTKQLLHFAQLKLTGRFQQFNFGKRKNMQKYGRVTPPDYNLSRVSAKVFLHYSTNDWLTVPQDIEKLNLALPNVVGKYLIKLPQFNHADFVWAVDASDLLYKRVTRCMKSLEGKQPRTVKAEWNKIQI